MNDSEFRAEFIRMRDQLEGVGVAIDEYDDAEHPADPQVLFKCVQAVARAIRR